MNYARPFNTATATPQLTEHERDANERAAAIAAREVYAHYLRTGSREHLECYEAWARRERAWPWPDPTPSETTAADQAVRGLCAALSKVKEGGR